MAIPISSATKDANPSIHLHAELLPNIRQVTLYISLRTDSKLSSIQPEIYLSESRRAVTVAYPEPHQDVCETIKLPARVSEAARRGLNIDGRWQMEEGKVEAGQGRRKRELSFRMPLDPSDGFHAGTENEMDDFVPWTARDMTASTKVRCKNCGNIILGRPASKQSADTPAPGWTWKDLPSGNWAEMMDFWHCHKPDPHEDDVDRGADKDPNAHVKGYGAANRVVAIPGTVLVDVATFLVKEEDCLGLIKVRFVFSTALVTPLLYEGQKEGGLFVPCPGRRYRCPITLRPSYWNSTRSGKDMTSKG